MILWLILTNKKNNNFVYKGNTLQHKSNYFDKNIIVGWLGYFCNKVNLNSYIVTPSSLRALFKSQHCTFNAWQASGIITRLVDMGFDFS